MRGNGLWLCVVIRSLLTSSHSLIAALPDTLQAALDEVKQRTNFNAFLITGGPGAMGTGTLQVFPYVFYISLLLFVQYSLLSRVQTGRSNRTGRTFEEFLGPSFKTLKNKYCEWLNESYSTFPTA